LISLRQSRLKDDPKKCSVMNMIIATLHSVQL